MKSQFVIAIKGSEEVFKPLGEEKYYWDTEKTATRYFNYVEAANPGKFEIREHKIPTIDLIDKYLKINKCTPLEFYKATSDWYASRVKKLSTRHNIIYNEDLRTAVISTIDSAVNYASWCKDKYETRAGASRSAIDIWRHIRYFLPETNIEDVMDTLYKLIYKEELLSSHYCGTVHRRVFYRARIRSHIDSANLNDEFGLKFSEWKKDDE